jgi:hypothetical protein
MNANAVAKHYGSLSPEERFRLILAASARGDEAERERLVNAGGRITLSMRDHSPYAHSFSELNLLVFVELLEQAAGYFEAFFRADEAADIFGGEAGEEGEGDDTEDGPDAEGTMGGKGDLTPAQRALDLALALGFMLRTKAEGWKLWCERLKLPPFLFWEELPGFDRLQRALALAEKAAFVSEGFLQWLNRVRPEGSPVLSAVPLSVEGVADAIEHMFQNRVEWWGGS